MSIKPKVKRLLLTVLVAPKLVATRGPAFQEVLCSSLVRRRRGSKVLTRF